MVWFHGGGFIGSSGNDVTWNFHRLPQNGVVVVTVNTRLGALGLLAHPELTAESPNGGSGNSMFLDQIAALKWVQRNISKFGGNPKNVTIFGQSGGARKVMLMLASPLAKGLFHKGIIQSGAKPVGAPLALSEAWGQQYFAKLGVATLAEARALPWQDLVDAFLTMPALPDDGMTLDGWFLPDTVPNIFSSGHQNAAPLIIQSVLGELGPRYNVSWYVQMFKDNLKVGTKGYAAIFNQLPANWEANGQQSFHALDLAYTFGVYDDPYADMWQQMTARTTLMVPPELGEQDQIVSEGMMTMWTQFAKTGDPNVPGKAKRSVYWPAWTPSGDKYLYLDEGLQINSGFSAVGP
jgi:para-nitrobenzyl esterase